MIEASGKSAGSVVDREDSEWEEVTNGSTDRR
jgi:hypothetical protein